MFKKYGNDISFLYVISSKNYREIISQARESGFCQAIYIDTLGVFAKRNSHIPKESMYHVFLLDNENHIILVIHWQIRQLRIILWRLWLNDLKWLLYKRWWFIEPPYQHNENQKSQIIDCRCNVGSDDSWMVEWLFIFIILMYVFWLFQNTYICTQHRLWGWIYIYAYLQ